MRPRLCGNETASIEQQQGRTDEIEATNNGEESYDCQKDGKTDKRVVTGKGKASQRRGRGREARRMRPTGQGPGGGRRTADCGCRERWVGACCSGTDGEGREPCGAVRCGAAVVRLCQLAGAFEVQTGKSTPHGEHKLPM